MERVHFELLMQPGLDEAVQIGQRSQNAVFGTHRTSTKHLKSQHALAQRDDLEDLEPIHATA